MPVTCGAYRPSSAAHRHLELVGGHPRVGAHAPVAHQPARVRGRRVVGGVRVEAERDLGVADVHAEQHRRAPYIRTGTLSISRVPPIRAATSKRADPVGGVGPRSGPRSSR